MTEPRVDRFSGLVGREDELALLDRALQDARTSVGGTVCVTGEPGIGKTRLAGEAITLAREAGMTVLKGRCIATGPAVPYRSLTEALLSLARAGGAPPTDALGPYLPVLGRLVPEWAIGDACDRSPIVLAEAVVRLAAACGRERGCLLVIDDLHDADLETLAVLEYLAANLALLPVAVVATLRDTPGAAHALADTLAQRGEAGLVRLGRLGAAQVHALTASCLGCPPDELPVAVSDRVLADSSGIPFTAVELIRGMRAEGRLVRTEDRWQLVGTSRAAIPFTLVRAVEQRAERLGPQTLQLLSAAAVLGRSFPLSVARRCAAPDDHEPAGSLRSAVVDGLLVPDDERGPDWYAFEHPLTQEALLDRLTPADRAELAARAVAAMNELDPGLPGTWCLLAARLHGQAGDRRTAAVRYLEVARRALAGHGPGTAIAVLHEARSALGPVDGSDIHLPDDAVPAGVRRELLETLLLALADDGRLDRATEVAQQLRRADVEADPGRRVELHMRLAWAAQVAGQWDVGLEQVRAARELLPEGAGARDTAGIDVVEAYLMVSTAEQGRIGRSEQLARRAIEGAEQRGDHALACQAWYAMGFATRGRSLAESDQCFRRTLRMAAESRQVSWHNHGLIGLGSNAWLAEADLDGLHHAQQEAMRTGCVSLAHNVGAMLALDAVLRADFDRATALLDGPRAETERLQLHSVTRYALMVGAVAAAHRARRPQLRSALARFRTSGGNESREAPLVLGLAELFCALLEEDHEQAAELAARLAAAVPPDEENYFHLAGSHGLVLLLSVLAGRADWAEVERITASQAGRMRWNRQFVGLARAVLYGREGRPAEAVAACRAAQADAVIFPTARHLGLRLVTDAAVTDGWGEVRDWLTEAETYFHHSGADAIAAACRSRLRSLGAPVGQRRTGTDRIPAELVALGVTMREYDVFCLLVERVGNKAVAARLQISPRTVEKHIASLIGKTNSATRAQLCDFVADFLAAR
ncbi:AAA family ATPase [Kitasatospora sp. NPDC005856]|uniref:ATP-binding protein n=1 Tax=Kitasatospora sp. NPDC005856 TaxID=3154566 RepID=UPI0034064D86